MIPLNLVASAAVGAVSMYVYKDDSAKQRVVAAGKKLKDGATSLVTSFKKKPKPVDAAVVEAADATAAEAESVAQ